MDNKTVLKFHVVGMGPGSKKYVLPEALKVIEQAEVLFGAEKLIAPFTGQGNTKKGVSMTGSLDKFLDKLNLCRQTRKAAVLVSGDPGFYSLLGPIRKRFAPKEYEVVPGLTAYQLACAQIGLSWHEYLLTSVHGRPMEELDKLTNTNQGVIILTDHHNNPARISRYLEKQGWNDRTVWICEKISYPEEKIEELRLKNVPYQKEYKLCLMIIAPACGE